MADHGVAAVGRFAAYRELGSWALAIDPFAPNNNVRKLTSHPGYRLRVGDWRVAYLIHERALLIAVVRITSRGKAYQ